MKKQCESWNTLKTEKICIAHGNAWYNKYENNHMYPWEQKQNMGKQASRHAIGVARVCFLILWQQITEEMKWFALASRPGTIPEPHVHDFWRSCNILFSMLSCCNVLAIKIHQNSCLSVPEASKHPNYFFNNTSQKNNSRTCGVPSRPPGNIDTASS